MARSSRKSTTIEIVCTPLEEHIPVKYVIVGTSEWIDNAFEPSAVQAASRLVRVSDPSHLHRVKEWLDKHKRHLIDTEGTGLNPLLDESKLLMMQIGNEDLVFVVEPQLIPEFKSHLEDPSYIHVFQNAVHDWKFFYHQYNVHINNIYDTMLGEQLLTSGRVGMLVNLMAMSRRRPPYRIITKAQRTKFVAFTGKFTLEMVHYAVRDVVLMAPIVDSQMADLKALNMELVATDEFNLVTVTGSMELGGVPFNQRTLRLSLLYWEERQRQLEQQILAEYDKRMNAKGADKYFLLPDLKFEFDVGSNSQKLEALRNLGLELDDVKRNTLEEINDPIAALLGEYSEAVKVTSTYGENMIKRINAQTKRLQVEFNQLGHGDMEAKANKATTIATGRYSSDFQQLPKARNIYDQVRGEELEQIKAMFQDKITNLLKEAA